MLEVVYIKQKQNGLYQIVADNEEDHCDLLTAEEIAIFYEEQGHKIMWLYTEDLVSQRKRNA